MIRFLYFLTFSCAVLLTNCSGIVSDNETLLNRIVILSSHGDRLDISENEISQLTIEGRDVSNNKIEVKEAVTWESDNENITIDQNGLVSANSVGNSIVTARVNEKMATFEINIWDSSLPRTEIFVSDAGPNYKAPWQIVRAFNDGEYFEVFTDQNLSWPQDIVFLENQGIAIISNLSSNNITKYDLKDGSYKGVFASGVNGPTRMEIGPDSLLYVLQWQGDGMVKKFDLEGNSLGDFTNFSISQSIGMVWDRDGNFYVSTYSNGDGGAFVRKFDPDGNDLGNFISSNIQGATDIWFEGTNMLVNDYPLGVVKKFDSSGQFVSNFISGLNLNEGVDHLRNGNILIGNGGTSAVKMFSNQGNFIKDIIPQGTKNLALPNAVSVREVNR